MIIAFINQKGGCGKSTTAVHFAYWLTTAKRKKKVVLVDCDEQQSSLAWMQSLDVKIPSYSFADTNKIIEEIPELDNCNDYVVVDGPASAQEITRAILLISDLAILPVQPSGLDLHSTAETIRLISQAQKVRGEQLIAAAFISKAQKKTRLKDEAIAFLEQAPNLTLLKTVIHQRVVVADSFGQDATIWDLPKSSDSQDEYKSLFSEIWKLT
jgi:chromosome partitioning protein